MMALSFCVGFMVWSRDYQALKNYEIGKEKVDKAVLENFPMRAYMLSLATRTSSQATETDFPINKRGTHSK